MKTPEELKVVVIDDDMTMVALFKRMLQQIGYGNSEVISQLSMCPILNSPQRDCTQAKCCADVVIVDIMMPGMSGTEFLELQHRRGCKIPEENRALMTAGAKFSYKRTANELGCHFFNKPIKLDEFKRWLNDCCSRT